MLAALALLPVLALATPMEHFKRDGTSIVQAISYISSNLTQVNQTTNGFNNGDVVTALAILAQSNELITSVQNAGSVVSDSANLSESESGNVAYAILNLEPQIFSLLDNIVAHQPQFSTVIFGASSDFIVHFELSMAKNASDTFGAALIPKLTADYQNAAPQIITQIDDKFNAALQTFSS